MQNQTSKQNQKELQTEFTDHQNSSKGENCNQISQTNDMSSIMVNEQYHPNQESRQELRIQESISALQNNSQITNLTSASLLFRNKQQRQQIKYKNNLAYVLANRMPNNVRTQVVEIIKYYQQHMSDQIRQIHRLVQQNTRLRHKIQYDEDKQNMPGNNISQSSFFIKNEENSERISQLEECLLQKNKQITNLNKQMTQLIAKNKKYKKRICELEFKSPLKSSLTQF